MFDEKKIWLIKDDYIDNPVADAPNLEEKLIEMNYSHQQKEETINNILKQPQVRNWMCDKLGREDVVDDFYRRQEIEVEPANRGIVIHFYWRQLVQDPLVVVKMVEQ